MYALDGIRVLDLSRGWAGPLCASLLGSMGAEVIKVESSTEMDFGRLITQGTKMGKLASVNQNPIFNVMNVNKSSITINLDKGSDLIRELITRCDIVVENFVPGHAEAFGLSYEQVSRLNPKTIMVSFTCSGQSGPEANTRGYAPTFAALGGLSEMTGYPDGPPSQITPWADIISAFAAFLATAAAINQRDITGQGQHIDCAGREIMSCFIGDSLVNYAMNGTVESRCGNRDDVMAPCNCYPCKGDDEWVSLAVADDAEWKALCRVMKRPDWTKDAKFSGQLSRWQNQDEMDKLIATWTVKYTPAEIMKMLQKAGVAAVPSFNFDDLACDAHILERDASEVIDHPEMGPYFRLNLPWKTSATKTVPTRRAPLLGEHTGHILKEVLGKSEAEIAELTSQGVLK
ncbi:MAG: CoA transferase [Dehalococcoidales bacterium]|nr:CoA transferase [Dehalococcoidales bacterium]